MTLLALTLSFSGFTALSLAMEKHQMDLYAKERATPQRMRQWRIVGWLLLSAAFALCVAHAGWALGPVLWLGALTFSGVVLAFGLYPYRPRWIAPLAWALPALGLVASLWPGGIG